MFIRQTKKQRKSTGKTYYQFSLVRSVRIDGKSRQRIILYLGSEQELRDKTNHWQVLEALKGMITGNQSLFDDIPEPSTSWPRVTDRSIRLNTKGSKTRSQIRPKPMTGPTKRLLSTGWMQHRQ